MTDSSNHPIEKLFRDDPELSVKFPFLIENVETGEMTLCKIWTLKELGRFLVQYGEECYKKGQGNGFSQGYVVGNGMKNN